MLEDQNIRYAILKYVLEKGISARKLGFSPNYINRVKRRLLPVSDNLLRACLKFLNTHELEEILLSPLTKSPITDTERERIQFFFKIILQLVYAEKENGTITEEELKALNLDYATLKFIKERFLIRKKGECYLLDKRNSLVREAYVFVGYLEKFDEEREKALQRLRAIRNVILKLAHRLETYPIKDRELLITSIVVYDTMIQEEEAINKALLSLCRANCLHSDVDCIKIIRLLLDKWHLKFMFILRVLTPRVGLSVDIGKVLELVKSIPNDVEALKFLKESIIKILSSTTENVDLPKSLINNFWYEMKSHSSIILGIVDQKKMAYRFSRILWDLVLEELEDYIDYLKNEELRELEKVISNVVSRILEVSIDNLYKDLGGLIA